MKKILMIADQPGGFNINGDTTYLMLLTARDMGFEISFCLPSAVFALGNQAFANVAKFDVRHGLDKIYTTKEWYQLAAENQSCNLSEFAAILVRNNPPFDMEYYYLTQILELAEKSGTQVINHTWALRNYNEKLSILNFPELITPTLVSKNKDVLRKFIAEHQVCVAKPIDMMAGRGVFQVRVDDPNQNVILETLSDHFTQTIMIQRFIPEVTKGDKRIFIINGQVVDYCLYRIPQNGQIRGNLAVGGRGEVHKLTDSDYQLANKVASWLSEHKIIFAGIDVIGNYLTEINITSPTGAHQILRDAGINVCELVLQAI